MDHFYNEFKKSEGTLTNVVEAEIGLLLGLICAKYNEKRIFSKLLLRDLEIPLDIRKVLMNKQDTLAKFQFIIFINELNKILLSRIIKLDLIDYFNRIDFLIQQLPVQVDMVSFLKYFRKILYSH